VAFQSITLIGDAAHLMTPFAGVGVNVAMDDALELSHALTAVKDQKAIGEALQNYEVGMWKRAEQAAEATMGYLGLFFHERGGIAMVEHFDRQKKAEAEAKAVSNGVNRAELP
jgi:2-polyprenyl-6-methoxyphenol hydroxylase-like FAD-dependent oxidoreductase